MLAGATPGSATNRPERLHQFCGPVNQQSAEFVEWCPAERSQTCDAKQPRGDWRHEPRDPRRQRSTTPVNVQTRRPEAIGNKASPREWCPQGCGASASHKTTASHPHAASGEEQLRGQSTSAHTQCGDERSSEATASSHAQRLEKRRQTPNTVARQASLEQRQHLWRCG